MEKQVYELYISDLWTLENGERGAEGEGGRRSFIEWSKYDRVWPTAVLTELYDSNRYLEDSVQAVF